LFFDCKSFQILLLVLQRLVREHSIVTLLAEVSSRALQVLLQATHKEAIKAPLIHCYQEVQSLLPSSFSAWVVSCGNDTSPADKQLVAEQVQQTGGKMQRIAWCVVAARHCMTCSNMQV
jgi:hypothetical protein